MIIENIFKSLIETPEYFRLVYPHLSEAYFSDRCNKIIFSKILSYNTKYSKQPAYSDIKILIESDNNISIEDSETCYAFIDSLHSTETPKDAKLLVDSTEQWCQERALENAILESVEILQKNYNDKGKIKEKIEHALSIEFDVKIGTDLFIDAPARYEQYVEEEEIISSGLKLMDQLLNGGWRKKAIHLFTGKPNVGKSLILCHFAAAAMKSGKNVLYVSAEMSEMMISKRIDANLLDIEVNSLNKNLIKKEYLSKVKQLCETSKGKLIVKEYPTSSANSLHIKNLLLEIKSKRGFLPDIIFLDYLNIFSSSKLNNAASLNSYQYIKSVGEEMRALAVEFDIVLVTATQINREGSGKGSDVDMSSISESYGTAMTADYIAAIIQTPELFEQNKYLFKNLKSRYDSNINQIVTVGVDYSKMKLFDLDESNQEIPLHIRDALKYQKEKENFDSSSFDFS